MKISAGSRRAAFTAVAIALLTATSLVSPTQPAQAAAGDLQVSSDGVNFGSTYAGGLFTGLSHVVPGDSQSQDFYLRNDKKEAGYLRIIIRNATYSDLYFANALTVQMQTSGFSGERVAVSQADPCWLLLEGQVLPPGGVVRVDATMLLGNLDGRNGQGASAVFSIGASLSDTTPGALSPAFCGDVDVDVPMIGASSRSGLTNPSDPVAVPTSGVRSNANGLPVLSLPGGIVIDPNTWRLNEWILVLVLFGAFASGTGWYLIAARRRRSEEAEAGGA